jgi:hypothetical protein
MIDTTWIQRIIRDYCEQVYINILDNLEEMGKFVYNLSRLNHEQIENQLSMVVLRGSLS